MQNGRDRALKRVARDLRLVRGVRKLSSILRAARLLFAAAVCTVVCADLIRLIRRG